MKADGYYKRHKEDTHARLMDESKCKEVVNDILNFTEGGGHTHISLNAWWNTGMRWARNRISLASTVRNVNLEIHRQVSNGSYIKITSNQIDKDSLRSAVRFAEHASRLRRSVSYPDEFRVEGVHLPEPEVTIWSQLTFDLPLNERVRLSQSLSDNAERHDLLSAGYMEIRGSERANSMSDTSQITYTKWTQSQCSMTVRHPRGIGSGWAGLSSFDWGAIDASALSNNALEKCLASLNPVRIEPGRYTVVLEPQATGDLIGSLNFRRKPPEVHAFGPWFLGLDQSLGIYRTKLGIKIFDERINIHHDPADIRMGVLPKPGMRPIQFVKDGILVDLTHEGFGQDIREDYTLPSLNENDPAVDRPSFYMSGGNASIDELIADTERGLLVTRFFRVGILDRISLLSTGITRDGLWLIENGKVSKSVHNMRFTESPLFVLNQIDRLGVSQPVFKPEKDFGSYWGITPLIVPSIKARDFSFTSLVDAV